MFTLDALNALYSRKKKKFRVAGNRCLQFVESIFVNLPQFAKSGLKESLNRFFWYFPLHRFGYFGLVSSLFVSRSVWFTAVLSLVAPSKPTVGRPRWRASLKYIRLHESVFFLPSSFYIECKIVNKGPVEISWKQDKRVNLTHKHTMLFGWHKPLKKGYKKRFVYSGKCS